MEASLVSQPPLFELPEPASPGWQPLELGGEVTSYWAEPEEMEPRLDASYYVVARRGQRLLERLACTLAPLEAWAEVNPASRRLPAERGYLLYNQCRYAQIRDVKENCWLLGPELPVKNVRALPLRAAFQPQTGDLLLPRVYSSLHQAVMVLDVEMPLVASNAFALLVPSSRTHGLALLALLHHRLLGEQLWALASGTTVRSVSANKLGVIQVPELAAGTRAALAGRVQELLNAQAMVAYPGLQIPVSEYWLDGTLSHWSGQRQLLAERVMALIDQTLRKQA